MQRLKFRLALCGSLNTTMTNLNSTNTSGTSRNDANKRGSAEPSVKQKFMRACSAERYSNSNNSGLRSRSGSNEITKTHQQTQLSNLTFSYFNVATRKSVYRPIWRAGKANGESDYRLLAFRLRLCKLNEGVLKFLANLT